MAAIRRQRCSSTLEHICIIHESVEPLSGAHLTVFLVKSLAQGLYQLREGQDTRGEPGEVGLDGTPSDCEHVLLDAHAVHECIVLLCNHAPERIGLPAEMRPVGVDQLVLSPSPVPGPAAIERNLSWTMITAGLNLRFAY